jgi:hypothetical protein
VKWKAHENTFGGAFLKRGVEKKLVKLEDCKPNTDKRSVEAKRRR